MRLREGKEGERKQMGKLREGVRGMIKKGMWEKGNGFGGSE